MSLVTYSSGEEEYDDEYGGRAPKNRSGTKQKDVNYEEVNMEVSDDESQGQGGHQQEAAAASLFSSKEEYNAYQAQFETTPSSSGHHDRGVSDEGEGGNPGRRRTDKEGCGSQLSEYGPGPEKEPRPDADKRSSRPEVDKGDHQHQKKKNSVQDRLCQLAREEDAAATIAAAATATATAAAASGGTTGGGKVGESRRGSRDHRGKHHHHHRRRRSNSRGRRSSSRDRDRRRSSSKEKGGRRRSGSRERSRRRSGSRDRGGRRSSRSPPPSSSSRSRHDRNSASNRDSDHKRNHHGGGGGGGSGTVPPQSGFYSKTSRKLLGLGLVSKGDLDGLDLVEKQRDAQMAKLKALTGVELPKYYNPSAINPLKYAEQIKKRQMLWKKPASEEASTQAAPSNEPAKTSFNKWEETNFGNAQANEKFRRLMGIRSSGAPGVGAAATMTASARPPPPPSSSSSSLSSLASSSNPSAALRDSKSMFAAQEEQYERARAATHTMRGLGLGFAPSSSLTEQHQQQQLSQPPMTEHKTK